MRKPIHTPGFWEWLSFEIRWLFRRDWKLVKVQQGPWRPGTPVSILNPYFIEYWVDQRTGAQRIHECT